MGETRKYISLIILIITFCLYLGATVGNEWLIYDTDHVGLWQICRQNECSWMEYTPSYLVAFLDWYSCVRAFMVLSCIFTFLSIAVQVCNIQNEVFFHGSVVRGCAVMTCVCVLIGVVVYACEKHKNYEDTWGFGWTFWLACVGGMVSVATVPFLCICVNDSTKEFKPKPEPYERTTMQGPVIPLSDIAAETALTKEQTADETGSQGKAQSEKTSILAVSKKSSRSSKKGSVSFGKQSSTSITKSEYSSSEEATATADEDDDESYTSEGSSYTSSRTSTLKSSRTNLSQFV